MLSDFFKVTFRRNETQSPASDKHLEARRKSTPANYGQPIGNQHASDKRSEIPKKATTAKHKRTKDTSPASDITRKIIVYMRKHNRATTTEMSDFLGLSKARVRAILLAMTDDGTIEKIGGNRNAYYVLK